MDSSFLLLREIGSLKLNEQEEVRFSIDAYRGYRYVSIRRYLYQDNFAGPTRDGITLSPEMVHAWCPVLDKMPTDPKDIKLGTVAKLAKRPGICVVVTVVELRGMRGLDFRQWEQDKGFTKKGIFVPLDHWAQLRQLFANSLAALDEQPEIDF